MNLNKEQRKVVHSKPCGYSIIKGLEGCGKTTTAAYRMLYLKNQYCLYEEDRILMAACSEENIDYIKNIYNKVEDENTSYYLSLFNIGNDKLDFLNIDSIIFRYFSEYKKRHNYNYEVISDKYKKEHILTNCIPEIKKLYPKSKILKNEYIKFFIDEIKWIKSNNYLKLEEYQNAQRTGRKVAKGEGPRRLSKNSSTRDAIFNLMLLYNNKLKEENLIDYEDMVLGAIEQAKAGIVRKYPHIIVDEAEKLTKIQIDFIKELYDEKTYSNMTFIVNTDKSENLSGALVRRGKLNTKILGKKIKRYSLKISYKPTLEKVEENNESVNSTEPSSIEIFEYCDVRHKKNYEFIRDFSKRDEIIVSNDEGTIEYGNEELTELPIYNEIAAGMPILINPEQEDNFYIPKYWLKGIKGSFILKVKGDSMIGANINDGDHVVIRKQYNAQNRDLVAVDLHGSATLKRLFIGKDEILLMPENEKYDPIPVNDEGVSIIGIVIGIIKNKLV